MPKKATRKRKAKKSAARKPAKKATKKKILKKKPRPAKKTSQKKAAKKKKLQKKAIRKAPKKKIGRVGKSTLPSEKLIVEPGPPPRVIPPVEEPPTHEEAIGVVTHYYGHLGVAVAQINKGQLKIGDTIHIKGHTTDFTQTIESMEFEHRHVDLAAAGQSIGIKTKDHVREHDILYIVK